MTEKDIPKMEERFLEAVKNKIATDNEIIKPVIFENEKHDLIDFVKQNTGLSFSPYGADPYLISGYKNNNKHKRIDIEIAESIFYNIYGLPLVEFRLDINNKIINTFTNPILLCKEIKHQLKELGEVKWID